MIYYELATSLTGRKVHLIQKGIKNGWNIRAKCGNKAPSNGWAVIGDATPKNIAEAEKAGFNLCSKCQV